MTGLGNNWKEPSSRCHYNMYLRVLGKAGLEEVIRGLDHKSTLGKGMMCWGPNKVKYCGLNYVIQF